MAFVFSFVQLILWPIPLRVCYPLASILGSLLFQIKGLRKTVMKNIEIAFGREMDEKQKKEIARRTFVHFSKNIFEFMKLPRFSDRKILSMIDFEGLEILDRYKGKGAILNSAHCGNWEILGFSLLLQGYDFTAVMRPLSNKSVHKIILKYRDRFNYSYIIRDPGVKSACINYIKSGGFLALTADQNAGARGIFVDFLGAPASTFRGPAELAMTLKVPIIPVFSYRLPNNKLKAIIEPPLELADTGDFNADLIENTRRQVAVLEKYVRKYPDNYFWFHDRWKARPPGSEQKQETIPDEKNT